MDCFWGGSRGRSADPGAFADLVGPGGVLGGIPEGSWCVLGWFGISSIWVPCCRISGRTVRTRHLLTQSLPLRPLRPPAAPAVSPLPLCRLCRSLRGLCRLSAPAVPLAVPAVPLVVPVVPPLCAGRAARCNYRLRRSLRRSLGVSRGNPQTATVDF